MTRPKHIDRLMERLDPVDEASLDFYMADLEGQVKYLPPVRTRATIRQLALSCGFKLKEQPSGIMDLNPYVYEFAQALLAQHNASGVIQRGIEHGHY